ncbi:hypothetical protein B0X71_08945 [Planococcus lenghuensis]|uniref:Uncharacterized protein n=1 Tax=Planococcus lenghuensis TaxID=2213202 RepID=A0A1Q2KYA9_9BACL|nr:hypothetical protein B0X71_08945 [Planococcus lenghuensis]
MENDLLSFVLGTTFIALFLSGIGKAIQVTVYPMLALLMFFISLTFGAHDLKEALRKTGIAIL